MDGVQSQLLQRIATMLRLYADSGDYEQRDGFFDVLTAAYEDELGDAFARKGIKLTEANPDTTYATEGMTKAEGAKMVLNTKIGGDSAPPDFG